MGDKCKRHSRRMRRQQYKAMSPEEKAAHKAKK